ncbi:hypothetical protein RDV78_09465 [Bacillota bacterium LX-D]|nr:hypothetical protein [Bacillota bacterium LX-D]
MEINSLKNEFKSIFKKFNELCREVSEKNNLKKQELLQKLINDFYSYFSNKGYRIISGENKYTAEKNDFEISLIFNDDDTFLLEIPQKDVTYSLEIRAGYDAQKMIFWKHPLTYKAEFLMINGNVDEFLGEITDLEVLKKLYQNLHENILHYEQTLKNYDEVDFVYSFLDSNIEITDFTDIMEKHLQFDQ